jgi:hypothetical protein
MARGDGDRGGQRHPDGDRCLPFSPRRILSAALMATVCACSPQATTSPTGARTPEMLRVEQADAERRFAEWIVAHNTRVSRLETFESRASLELRYTDADGAHFDQCEADIFLAAGGRGAVRATKVGNNLLWVGSDGTRGWVFLLEKDPTALIVHDRIDESLFARSLNGGTAPGAAFLLLAPQSVRTLAGMRELPAGATIRRIEGAADDAPLEGRFELVFQPFPGVDATMRFGADGLPVQVRVLDRGGTVRLEARLAEYMPAQAANLAQGAWPKVPQRIEVDALAVENAGAGGGQPTQARIYLDAPLAMARRMKPRFFALEDLTAQLRPDSVQHVVAADGSPGGP